MKRIVQTALPAFVTGIAACIVLSVAAQAQVVSPNFWRQANGNLYPINGSNTIGTSTVDGSFRNLNVSGSCTGCGGGGGASSTGSSTVMHGINGVSTTALVNGSQTSSLDTAFAAIWNALQTFLKGINASGTINASGSVTVKGVPVSTATNTVSLFNGSGYTSSTPGGNNNNVQTKNGSTFAGSDVFTFDGTDVDLAIGSKFCFAASCSNLTNGGYIWANNGLRIVESGNSLPIIYGNTEQSILSGNGLTANRTFTFPDKDGTFAMTSDIAGGSGNTNSTGTANSIPIYTGTSTQGNSSLSQSGGTTYINGTTPIIDGGGNYVGNVIQSGPNSLIVQNPTSTAVVGNFVQGGGVQAPFTTTSTSSGFQFCGGGFIPAVVTSSISILLPTMATLASSTLTPCANSIWSGNFAQQFIKNSASSTAGATITTVANGPNEEIDYAPGTPTSLLPGQSYFAMGLFANESSTVLGATATGTKLIIYLTLYQSSTPLVASGNSVQTNQAQLSEPFIQNATSSGASTVINWNNGNKQGIVLGTATTTISFTNVKSGASYTLWVMQDGTGSRTVTWTTSGTGRIQWQNANTTPTLSTSANVMDVISFQCFTPQTTSTLSCYGAYGSGNFAQ